MKLTLTTLFTLLILQTFAIGPVTYYISASGSDGDGKTQATAWKTIAKLNANWSLIKPGDFVLFHAGETFSGTISPTVSGSVGLPITIGSYGTGARPIISSLTTLTGWTSNGSGIYTSATNNNLFSSVNIVFVNGEPVNLGRYPNADAANRGYLLFEAASSTTITDNELPSTPNWTGSDVVIRSRNWVLDRKIVSNHSGHVVTVPATMYTPLALFGYFFENDIKCLDQSFEWCYNKNTTSKTVSKFDGTSTTLPAKSISMYFGSNNPSSYTIQASMAERGIELTVTGQHDIVIDGLSVYGANSDAIYLTNNKKNIKITNCEINGVGNTGINGRTGAMIDCAIKNNIIRNCYNNGIDFNGTRDTVTNNLVRDIYGVAGMGGSGDGGGLGIKVLRDYAYIANNVVKNIGYIGINFGNEGWYNKVVNNWIDSFAIVKDDGGGIYTFNCVTGTTPIESDGHLVDANIISNGIGIKEGTTSKNSSAEGIYMDGKSRGVTITNNTLYNITDHALMFNGNRRMTVRYNTAYNCYNYLYLHSFDSLTANSKIDKSNIFAQNMFFSIQTKERIIKFLSKFDDWQDWGRIDSNYYCRPLNEPDNTTNGGLAIIELQTAPGTRYTAYTSTNYSLDLWKNKFNKLYDQHTKKTVKSITNASEVLFNSNNTVNQVNVSLAGKTYVDPAGVPYTKGSFTLPSFSSKILLVTPSVPLDASTPTAAITSPANNSTFTQPVNLTITANASESGGTISKVDFYNGNTLLGTDNTSPYSYTWNSVPTGNPLTITAKATDINGIQGYSSPVNIVVNGGNTPPKVSVDTPLNGSKYIAPATVRISSTATDNTGITKVEFYSNNVLIHTENNYPYSWDWPNVPAGSYSITAKAYDVDGLSTTSIASSISVRNLVAPDVTITSPAPNQTYTAPATINLAATATDPDGTIIKVEFYNNRVLVNTDLTSPYLYTLTNVPKGFDTIMVKAYDNDGNVTSSSVVSIVSEVTKKAPTVSITSPLSGAAFFDPANIVIVANANDADGIVSKVDFYDGSQLIGTAYTAPYQVTYSSVPVGSHSITAKATDNDGLTTTSNSISTTVIHINVAPNVDILSPKGGDSTMSTTFNMTVAANDPDGTITKVEILNGSTVIATLTNAPYSTDLKLNVGTYTLTAKAYDNSGAITSKTITYKVIETPVTIPIIIKGYKGIIK